MTTATARKSSKKTAPRHTIPIGTVVDSVPTDAQDSLDGTLSVADISRELQDLQRQRSIVIKSRLMQSNRLVAIVAGTLGYDAKATEKERRAKFKEAAKLIDDFDFDTSTHKLKDVLRTTLIGIGAFDQMRKDLEKDMEKLAGRLPVAAWVSLPAQRGFGLLNLAVVVGECGDLATYANPAKVWRRLGCAPWKFEGQQHMGSTWRRRLGTPKPPALPAEEWANFGYSPRRRAVAYNVGDPLIKGNKDGPYRSRYDVKKAEFKQKHPDVSDMHAHLHGSLLATKLLLRELWIEWNKK